LSEHEFRLNMLKTVFYGTCKKCGAGHQSTESAP
jgi:Fe2+ or Zn2+ uptake regulation protein